MKKFKQLWPKFGSTGQIPSPIGKIQPISPKSGYYWHILATGLESS
jgi:hypothetical protein